LSAKRKQAAVLRLLRGEPLELASRKLSVTAADLATWREAFWAAGFIEDAARERPTRHRYTTGTDRLSKPPAGCLRH
jgi:hypothetical protein